MKTAESERSMHTAQLVALADQIVRESGDPTGFDPAAWVAAVLDAPSGALGGRHPREFMDTDEGRAIVLRLVKQMQLGTYA